MMSTPAGRSSKFPLFTATQWQELEHQALIYKYMVAGIAIPPDLLFSIKRNLDSSLSTKLFPYQTSPIGWNPYQMGFGGKKIDPEPGRCRRTDGKKWRCSKEAYPDSKYCERHMHRGKNRSRKPVEVMATATGPNQQTTAAVPNPSPIISPSLSINKIPNPPSSSSSSSSSSSNFHSLSSFQPVASSDNSFHYGRSHHHHASSFDPHFLYPHSSYSRPPGNIDLSSQDSTAHLLFDSGSLSTRDRYLHGVKEEVAVGEHAFFTESSGTMRGFSGSSSMDESWQQQHHHNNPALRIGSASLDHTKQTRPSCTDLQSEYPYLELKTDISKQDKQNQQLHMWGRDFSSSEPSSIKVERESHEPRKTIHHFFDEWPPKGGRDSSPWHDSSTTQLSISMPTPSHDFCLSSSRAQNDG